MHDAATISAALEKASDRDHARKRGRHLRPMRGLRGVPGKELVGVLLQTWRAGRPVLPDDADELNTLFSSAFEDGLVAIGLVATVATKQPEEALELAWRWLGFLDDVETADALGWLVVGPALLAEGEDVAGELAGLREQHLAARKRVGLAGALAALPLAVEGPAAAALREQVGARRLAFVAEPVDPVVSAVAEAFRLDPDPSVRKGLLRLVKAWALSSPDEAEAWLEDWRGGSPRAVRAELERAIKKGRRLAARQVAAAAAAAEE